MRAQQALDSLDILLLLEARKGVKIVDGLGQNLRLLEPLAVVAALGDQRIDDERGFGQRECIDAFKFTELELHTGLFVAAGWGSRARSRSALGAVLHSGVDVTISLTVRFVGHSEDLLAVWRIGG